ncbi:hypothetical protein NC99_26440 [Sunxiuqinia dokdonensis]|uniref:Uncharacterized protein n=1 Tax=Sunxiuqinia dokdonensis TaxID=1409788 RepID=A0A0L8V7V3_9BACT|nr:hypothetical protein NC99_26440 [Sunxiuqinia dokdonensis]
MRVDEFEKLIYFWDRNCWRWKIFFRISVLIEIWIDCRKGE